jgi:hypothetical protein
MEDAVDDDGRNLPRTTQWYRRHGRPSRQDKAARQQYLSPSEEQALAEFMLHMAHTRRPLPIKSLRMLAQTIRRQRCSTFQTSLGDEVPPPGKNWPQGFYKRHPELRARRTKAIDRQRHDDNIYDKVVEWFSVIQPQLEHTAVLQENVYNMDETGVMLSVLGSLKVLVDRDELRATRPSCVQRTLITAVECISADGRSLHPLIIWPASIVFLNPKLDLRIRRMFVTSLTVAMIENHLNGYPTADIFINFRNSAGNAQRQESRQI